MRFKLDHIFPTLDVMGLIFIHYKVTGAVDWSWWVVLMPFIAPLIFAATVNIVKRIKFSADDDRAKQLAELMKMAESARKVGPRPIDDKETN